VQAGLVRIPTKAWSEFRTKQFLYRKLSTLQVLDYLSVPLTVQEEIASPLGPSAGYKAKDIALAHNRLQGFIDCASARPVP